jgi:outer membrane protein
MFFYRRGTLRTALTLVIGFLLLTPWATTLAQNLKLGYIDSIRIRQEYKGFADAQAKYDKEVEEWQRKAEELSRGVEELEKELESQRLLLSDEKRKEKESKLRENQEEYQQYVNQIFGPAGKAEQRNIELTKPLLEKINTVLEKVANEGGYDYIFDAANGNIAFAKKEFDLTDIILEELEEESE